VIRLLAQISRTPPPAAFFCIALLAASCSRPSAIDELPVASCSSQVQPIAAIQGQGSSSPRVGESVTVRGIVTWIQPGEGVFLEELASDEDPATSNALFLAGADVADQAQAGVFASLARFVTSRGGSLAVLLLAVMDLIEQGGIHKNFIEPSMNLVDTFNTYISLVLPAGWKTSMAHPFPRLQKDGFWHRVTNPDYDPEKDYNVTSIAKLNEIGGQHGVGRIDHIEDRLVGIKSREIYECPAAMVLLEAHADLEKMVLTRHENYFKPIIDQKWTELAYTGLWMDPLKDDLEAFINNTQTRVNGAVKVKLYKGHQIVVGRTSPNSLYDYDLATYEELSTFDQKKAVNFIQLWGLPTVVARNNNAKEY